VIRCALHRLLEAIRPDSERTIALVGSKTRASESTLVRDLRADPMYVFAEDIVRLLVQSESSVKSMLALAECGLVHLPYPAMTVQFRRQSDRGEPLPGIWFVSLREEDGRFLCRSAYLKEEGAPGYVSMIEQPFEVVCEMSAFTIHGPPELRTQDVAEAHGMASALAVRMACLMIHVTGLERETAPPPERLNRQRERTGRPPVRGYSYVHVATYQDQEGHTHRYSPTGRSMPIHMRAGHVRNQPFGPERAERRKIWIPPVVVNYHPERAERPVLERRVVR